MKAVLSGVTIELIKGDITSQEDIATIVNAANRQLATGGGVAGAIHRVASAELYEECRPLAPIKPGQSVITKAYQLPNKYVIHCLGPVYGVDKPEDKLLADCYINALKLAEENKIESIAFPAISTGAFGYPASEAVAVVYEVIQQMAPILRHVKKIRFVLYSSADLGLYQKSFSKLKE